VAASSTGGLDRRSTRATCSSVLVAPNRGVDDQQHASAVAMASSAWTVTAAPSPAAAGSHPPVSTIVNRRPFHSAS